MIFLLPWQPFENKSIISENKESPFVLKCCYSKKKYLSKLKQHGLPDTLSEEFSFKCLSVMIYGQFIVSIVELIMLSWQPTLVYSFHNMRVGNGLFDLSREGLSDYTIIKFAIRSGKLKFSMATHILEDYQAA